jgi:hypothetical protein
LPQWSSRHRQNEIKYIAIRKGGFFYDFTDFMDFTDFFCTFAAIIKKWAGLLQ